jgi:hypothetical protein
MERSLMSSKQVWSVIISTYWCVPSLSPFHELSYHKVALQAGLVEELEATGMRMFEERKDKAMKTQRYTFKNHEEEITPKLRDENCSYLQYKKMCTELECTGQLLHAWNVRNPRNQEKNGFWECHPSA